MLQAWVLLLGLLFLSLHAFQRSTFFLYPLLLAQAFNFVNEVIELRHKKASYFRDIWNWFDLLRFLFCFLYFGYADSHSPHGEVKLLFLTLFSLFQSLKAFSIFSLFKSTRVLLGIVIEIVKDMIPFFLFVFATNLVVSLLFTSATPRDQLNVHTFPQLMMHIFLLDFANFSIKQYSLL